MSEDETSRLGVSDGIAWAALAGLLTVMVMRNGFGNWRDALVLTVTFAAGGWLLRGVNAAGALAGGMVALMFFSQGGWRLFAVLFAVFLLTLLATYAGRDRKRALGLAEARGGRGAAQVAANLFVATAALVLLDSRVAVVVAVAALAEASADTVSSEMGVAFGGKTYLVTTLKTTQPGTNGGVSVVGTLAGVAAAICVAAVAMLVVDVKSAGIAAVAGVVGMVGDSVLGATLEKRGYLNNNAVNLLGTATAAGVALLWIRLVAG